MRVQYPLLLHPLARVSCRRDGKRSGGCLFTFAHICADHLQLAAITAPGRQAWPAPGARAGQRRQLASGDVDQLAGWLGSKRAQGRKPMRPGRVRTAQERRSGRCLYGGIGRLQSCAWWSAWGRRRRRRPAAGRPPAAGGDRAGRPFHSCYFTRCSCGRLLAGDGAPLGPGRGRGRAPFPFNLAMCRSSL